jgi:hypothetical protein
MIGHITDRVTVKIEAAGEAAAERMRRCRARRRAGYRCYVIELHSSEVEELVYRGFLQADERGDDGAVIDALSQHIEQTLGRYCDG